MQWAAVAGREQRAVTVSCVRAHSREAGSVLWERSRGQEWEGQAGQQQRIWQELFWLMG